MPSSLESLKVRSVWQRVNFLPHDKTVDCSKLKAFEDYMKNATQNLKCDTGREEKTLQKCCLPAYSPFPTMFSKAFFPRFDEIWTCVEYS